jgi:hypothetical protein
MAKNGSSTPYQPVQSGGILGFFQRLFVSTPAYRGDGQPQPRSGGLFGGIFGGQPAYKAAPPAPKQAPIPECDPASCDQLPDEGETDSSTEHSGCAPGQSAPLTIVIARD